MTTTTTTNNTYNYASCLNTVDYQTQLANARMLFNYLCARLSLLRRKPTLPASLMMANFNSMNSHSIVSL